MYENIFPHKTPGQVKTTKNHWKMNCQNVRREVKRNACILKTLH